MKEGSKDEAELEGKEETDIRQEVRYLGRLLPSPAIRDEREPTRCKGDQG
jgi:hypothetical protein